MTDETAEVMELLHRVQRSIHRSKVLTGSKPPWFSTPTLTMAQLRALMVLYDSGHLTVGQLAERLGTGMPATSSIVDRLVEEGLADRHQDPEDRRRIVVHPTKKGSGRIETMRQGPREVLEALVLHLDPDERGHVLVALRALARAAEEMQAENEDPRETPPTTTAAVPGS